MKTRSTFHNLSVLAIIFGFISTSMIFLSALIYTDTNSMFTGFQVAFGYQFTSMGPWASGMIEFSPVAIIAYFLPLFGSIYLIIRKKGFYVAMSAYLIAAILLSLIPFLTHVTVTVLGSDTSVNIDWGCGIGLTVSILFSIFAFMISLYVIAYELVYTKKKLK